MRELRSAWRMPLGLPATRWMAEIGAFAIRSDTELLLKSRRVVPGRLVDAGFAFGYPDWHMAAVTWCHGAAGASRHLGAGSAPPARALRRPCR